jgi:transcriptional regulator with XRE-family HTH domain
MATLQDTPPVGYGCARMESLSDHVIERLRAEMKRKKISTYDVAGMLKWTQSRVSHILNKRVGLGVDDLASFCFALGLSVPEVVRDQGMEFCAEMTPTELRLHERIRALPSDQRSAILTLLNVVQDDTKRALPPRKLRRMRE